ncbi:TetR family transcriptional regulator [Streptomyces malaysiensis subsp. malaysiensis]|uniref:TetR family transcriptional regulator n=1 Tax=Streptomyces malaysiensis TaxID=92644 RepID=A0ABX6W8D2_STRMQ|nr:MULTISPECIES: TetR/AcrR family transcriptional regulator [Streptomyces]QPI56021.1 TetR family transcriptional regulator [Streptomyces solisilvae]UHH17490.1 TetR/AcrR family transcriptional regulator [Streptomyces sp. HNM0561]
MPRWESDAQGRLERAALELFETQGFERTSVAQIARTAGLTERSFYRYFPDKREVLFADNELEAHLVAQVEAADPSLSPIEALLTALGTADEVFHPRDFLLRRIKVIAANPALAERDLIKLADIADALARALERRGVEPGKARFIIDVAIAISRRATSRWLAEPDTALSELVAQAAAELCETVTPPALTVR